MLPFALGLLLMSLQATAALRAGAAITDVTPEKLPVIVNCFMTERLVDRVTSRLYARSLVLDDGATRLSLTVVDSCMMPRELLDRAKALAAQRTGIPAHRMLISATHTHMAPAAMACLGSDAQQDYADWLPGKIAESITQAASRLEPAQAGWAIEDAPSLTHTRRFIYRADKMLLDPFGNRTVRANMHPGYQNPDAIAPSGPSDPALTLFSVQTNAGQPLALLANFSQHYFNDTPLSADYFGLFTSKMAARIAAGPTFVPILSQGTSGDQMWMDYSRPKSDATLDSYTEAFTEAALRAYRRIVHRPNITLGMRETLLTLRRRLPDEQRLAWARAKVREFEGRKPKTQPEIYAREQLFLHQEPERELKLQTLRIGDLAIHAIPNEVYALTGLKLKAQTPFAATMNIELANGADGYIPPPEQHVLGGYTTWAARTAGLEVQAEPRIVEALLTMAESLAGTPRRTPREPDGPYIQSILAARPLAHWRFSEMSGPVALDRVRRLPALFENGVALYLDGPQSNALTPAATNRAPHLAGGAITAQLPPLGPAYTLLLSVWNGVEGAAPTLLTLGGDTVALRPDGTLTLNAQPATAQLPPRQWQQLALVRNGATATLFLNGHPVATAPASTAPPTTLVLGGDPARRALLEGKLDEATLFARALTAQQVAAFAQGARPASPRASR
ncbi:MAG: hypothetical protein IPJ98_30800 [Bryobacterales bacterium]|nr:hypothetical protein [Bryobacterales bacterium]